MFVYWTLFAFFALGTLTEQPARPSRGWSPYMLFSGLLIILMVGLRREVGADWITYMRILKVAGHKSLASVISAGDPGYQFLNWLALQFDFGIWFVNLVCAILFTYGLIQLVRTQSHPRSALLISFPYLVIVVAMGYTRQAAALGILMAGLASVLRGGGITRFFIYGFVAGLFHSTAVIIVPMVTMAIGPSRLQGLAAAAFGAAGLYFAILGDHVTLLINTYARGSIYQSQGAVIRVAMCAIPAIIMFILRRRIDMGEREKSVWTLFSFASLATLAGILLNPTMTAIDRIAIYLIPLQFAVVPRAIRIFFPNPSDKISITAWAFLIQFVWLNYAGLRTAWVPYNNFFF